MDPESLKAKIREAFEGIEYPGDWCLRGSNEGEEPYLLEAAFKGKVDRYALDPAFLDQAPDGFASALNFFSDEAFRFYLPAYLIADLDDRLLSTDPVFHLTHGLDAASRSERINPRRYGEMTWFDHVRRKFSMFDRSQVEAIVAYLEARREAEDQIDLQRTQITEALETYWYARTR
ncbi:MAG: DUF6714 family protein [Planctomycetota bacterium]